MKSLVNILATIPLMAGSVMSAATAPKEPIYIYLYARVTDHVNLEVTEDRLHRLLPMLAKHREEHPDAHVTATILFSGAVSEALAERNSQTHIVDFVRKYISQGVIEPGYDGADEPTYEHRPLLDFSKAQTPEDRWKIRVAANEQFLTEARDPLTGSPEPGRTGGLKRMREVFGEPAFVDGMTMWMNVSAGSQTSAHMPEDLPDAHFSQPLRKPTVFLKGLKPEIGGDSELVVLLRRDGMKPVMSGITERNPGFVPGFGAGRRSFGEIMGPVPNAAPELFWQDNVLRVSEASGTVHVLHARDGVDLTRGAIGKVDRSTVHVVHLELASDQDYLQPAFIKGGEFPPLKYAYDHPQNAKLPGEALLPAAAVDAAYAKEEGVLKWLVEDFFPAETGSHVVSNAELVQEAGRATGFDISITGLRAALADYLKMAGTDTILPPAFQADGHYLSLADMFQTITDAFAEYDRTGRLPVSVKVAQVYGPIALLTGHGPNEGEVSLASIVHTCAEIDPPLHDQSSGTIPKNAIPDFVTVGGVSMNPAQFLRLMAHALVNFDAGAKLPVRMTYSFTGSLILYPKLRNIGDAGFGWTLKPAPLNIAPEHTQSAGLMRQ